MSQPRDKTSVSLAAARKRKERVKTEAIKVRLQGIVEGCMYKIPLELRAKEKAKKGAMRTTIDIDRLMHDCILISKAFLAEGGGNATAPSSISSKVNIKDSRAVHAASPGGFAPLQYPLAAQYPPALGVFAPPMQYPPSAQVPPALLHPTAVPPASEPQQRGQQEVAWRYRDALQGTSMAGTILIRSKSPRALDHQTPRSHPPIRGSRDPRITEVTSCTQTGRAICL